MQWRDPASAHSEFYFGEAVIGETGIDRLTTAEREIFDQLRSPKRRLEFQAGRIAAHQALEGALGGDSGAVEVLHAADGAPMLFGSAKPLTISIAHGQRRAVAVVGATRHLGIDHCDLAQSDRLIEIAPRYLSKEMPLLSSPWSFAACWAAKEAGLKALRLGLLEGNMFGPGPSAIRVVSLDPPRLDPPHLSLTFGDLPEGPVAIVWAP